MGKAKGKHRLDKYYHLAKEHGYRSRASWKLIQLDSKFHFLHSSRAVLDLCAAPGGWMQVAVERVPVGSLVLGIDLVRIAPIRGAISIEQDITKSECKARIKKIMGENGVKAFDLVLHDGSPNIGGAWAQEAMAQNALVIDSVKLATQFLAPKGNFVTKVFRSQDYNSVLYCLHQLFEKVEVDKPSASRSTSAEIFLVGLKYKAPAKIDPRLLDVKHLFQGTIEPVRKVIDVLRGTKQKRHRDGYEDGESIVRKVSSAADFVWSDTPLEILGSVTSISFEDPTSLPIRDHALTTEEVKTLCDDLRVLGKQDFKHLLKPGAGHLNLVQAWPKCLGWAGQGGIPTCDQDKARKATGMQIDAMEDGYTDHELFSLSSIKGDGDDVVIHSDQDSDEDLGDQEANPLVVSLNDGEVPTKEEITSKWFAQGVFAEAAEDGDLEKYDSEAEMQVDRQEEKLAVPEKTAKIAAGLKHNQPETSKTEEDFEIVPAPATDSSDDSSSDDSDNDDVETKAEILAYAKKMLRKKQREQMLDDAYNKYMFDDEGLPSWFVEEEKRHCQPMKPVTKEEIAAIRAQFKEINARPAKKVAEAKAKRNGWQ
ncbi:hypothetical protein GH714_033021 [Hevea brasiliensis]|uniref:rRNA methyltransferase n=1 Tax=Hevea brasiliensis TaxID=3981 RepID=A0A6A6MX09_HEVBR|nr:hypothetical protein GH714_033021 [Hevea brasiliensis]